MKKLKLCCLIWMLIIILGCKTIEYVKVPVTIEVDLDTPPERDYLEPREEGMSLSVHLINRVFYYSDLVKKWESWGISVYESIDQPLPESLELAKNKMEVTDE